MRPKKLNLQTDVTELSDLLKWQQRIGYRLGLLAGERRALRRGAASNAERQRRFRARRARGHK